MDDISTPTKGKPKENSHDRRGGGVDPSKPSITLKVGSKEETNIREDTSEKGILQSGDTAEISH